jgi:alkylation response protein AidB-like acyl-CoA dehydrogenase
MDMNSPTRPTLDACDLPESLRLAITAAASESERQSDIGTDLRNELRDAGAFRLLTPRELGGWEAPLTTVLDIYERFGHIDASVGLLVWNANFGFVGAMLDSAGVAQIWAAGIEPVFANSGQPGTAEPVDGGYRLSGEWKIVSGINGADWVILIGRAPEVRFFAVRRNQVDVRDSWDVTGMRATGSNNVTADSVFVPQELTAALDAAPRIDRPIYRGFIPTLVFPGCTAVALGVARRAIEETVALVGTKPAMGGGTVADAARTQYAIAKSEAAVSAARLLLSHTAGDVQNAGDDLSLQQRAALRAAMSHAADICRQALVAMYEIAGSTALYRSNPIERVFRDGMAALQHVNHSAPFLEAAGRVRLGLDPAIVLF